MTREEAIDVIVNDIDTYTIREGLALNIAIKALEQESCEDWHDVPSSEMTLEQARQAVKDLRKKLMEYLEQEPTTKNNLGVDLIDRAELLKAMDTWDKFGYTEAGCFVREPKGDYVPYVHYEDMVNCVKGMPAVTPQEPKTGHGVKYGIPRCGEQHYKCTNCDEYFNFGLYSDYYKKAFKYCPNCGCAMVEPQESEG